MSLIKPQPDPSDFISTGRLPHSPAIIKLVEEAHLKFKDDSSGQRSQVYPALAEVPADLFGICVAGIEGNLHSAGDVDHDFTIMSVSKPFVFALICQVWGAEAARNKIGVNSTGLPFNSVSAIERFPDGRTNPMVNAGAIATTSLVPGKTYEEKWHFIHEGLSKFAGRDLPLNDEIYQHAAKTNFRNRGLANFLHSLNNLGCDPLMATDLYTKQCCLNITAKELAIMGATLADGGVNPITQQRVVDNRTCHYTLAVMATAGLYETSGDWLYDVGLPGKSGIGGGIVTVSPGKGGLGTFAPLLDAAGNSVKGQHTARFLSRRLGMDLFVSRPYTESD